MLENLKKTWGTNSNLQVIKIIIVFGITGSLAAWLSKPFISFLNIVDEGTFLSWILRLIICLLYTSPSPRDRTRSRMPSSA